MAPYPPFTLHSERYDQTTYLGRLRRCLDMVDPSTLFTSTSTLNRSVDLLQQYKEGKTDANVTDAELWKAKKVGFIFL